MLLGVRQELGDELVTNGERLRIYVPFGRQWYEYSLRRLHENPKIAGYIAGDTVRPDVLPGQRPPVAATAPERLAVFTSVEKEGPGTRASLNVPGEAGYSSSARTGSVMPRERADDLAEAMEPRREVVLAPVQEAVDAERGWVLVEEQEVAAGASDGRDVAREQDRDRGAAGAISASRTRGRSARAAARREARGSAAMKSTEGARCRAT